MGSMVPSLGSENDRMQSEHLLLLRELHELDKVLDALPNADPGTVTKAVGLGARVAGDTFQHFREEELGIQNGIATWGLEGSQTLRQMQIEHDQLGARLNQFCHALAEVADRGGVGVGRLQQIGKELTRDLAAHMESEQQRIEALLNSECCCAER